MQFIWRTLSSLVSEEGVQQARQEGFLRIKVGNASFVDKKYVYFGLSMFTLSFMSGFGAE